MKKQTPCTFFQQGKCIKQNCDFVHVKIQQDQQVHKQQQYQTGHNRQQQQFQQSQNSQQYHKGGHKEQHNQGGHQQQQFQQQQQQSKQNNEPRVCSYYKPGQKGSCNKGDKCEFQHLDNINNTKQFHNNDNSQIQNKSKGQIAELIQNLKLLEKNQDEMIKILKYQQFLLIIGKNAIYTIQIQTEQNMQIKLLQVLPVENDIHYATILYSCLVLATTSKQGQNKEIQILQMDNLSNKITIPNAHEKFITSIQALDQMKIILSSSQDGYLKCWNLQPDNTFQLQKQNTEILSKMLNFTPIYYSDLFQYNNKNLLLLTYDQAKVAIIDLNQMIIAQKFDLQNPNVQGNQIVTQVIINQEQDQIKMFANILQQPQQNNNNNKNSQSHSCIKAFIQGNPQCNAADFPLQIYPDQAYQQKSQKFFQNIVTKTLLLDNNQNNKILVSASSKGSIELIELTINQSDQNSVQTKFRAVLKDHQPNSIIDMIEFVYDINFIKNKHFISLDDKGNLNMWKINL